VPGGWEGKFPKVDCSAKGSLGGGGKRIELLKGKEKKKEKKITQKRRALKKHTKKTYIWGKKTSSQGHKNLMEREGADPTGGVRKRESSGYLPGQVGGVFYEAHRGGRHPEKRGGECPLWGSALNEFGELPCVWEGGGVVIRGKEP